MKLHVLILITFFLALAQPAAPQQASGALTKNEVMTLVKFGMNSADLAKKIHDLGINFEATDDYLQALRQAGAQEEVIEALRAVKVRPLTQEQVGKLVVGGVLNQRAAALVEQYGIDFLADEEYLKTLRLAGADDTLIGAVRAASAAAMGTLVIGTSANAEVSLDGEPRGFANGQGELVMKAHLGTHTLKIALAGKRDFVQTVNLTSVHAVKIEARLEALWGKIAIHTSPGADVFLDGTRIGAANGAGQFAILQAAPGSHELRISASGRADYRQSISVTAGEESRVEAVLAESLSVAGTVWAGTDSDGDYYEYHFQEDGSLHYKSPQGFFTAGTWKQQGMSIYMETNNKYAERQGTITGNHMEGNAWNKAGHRWTWKAEKKP
jgi:hypothetical protein